MAETTFTDATISKKLRVPLKVQLPLMSVFLLAGAFIGEQVFSKFSKPIQIPVQPVPAEHISTAIASIPRVEAFSAPTAQPTPEISRDQAVMDQATNVFLGQLSALSNSDNIALQGLYQQLSAYENSGGALTVSAPRFDTEGRMVQTGNNPVICGYDKNGNFLVEVNTSMYAGSQPVTPEVTGAYVAECMSFRSQIEQQLTTFKASNPDASTALALQAHPAWIENAAINAWYGATEDVLIPNRQKIPQDAIVARKLMGIYDQSGGDENVWKKLMQAGTLAQSMSS
jgi:hypothetical protein